LPAAGEEENQRKRGAKSGRKARHELTKCNGGGGAVHTPMRPVSHMHPPHGALTPWGQAPRS
jgi:hypothetical protein